MKGTPTTPSQWWKVGLGYTVLVDTEAQNTNNKLNPTSPPRPDVGRGSGPTGFEPDDFFRPCKPQVGKTRSKPQDVNFCHLGATRTQKLPRCSSPRVEVAGVKPSSDSGAPTLGSII